MREKETVLVGLKKQLTQRDSDIEKLKLGVADIKMPVEKNPTGTQKGGRRIWMALNDQQIGRSWENQSFAVPIF